MSQSLSVESENESQLRLARIPHPCQPDPAGAPSRAAWLYLAPAVGVVGPVGVVELATFRRGTGGAAPESEVGSPHRRHDDAEVLWRRLNPRDGARGRDEVPSPLSSAGRRWSFAGGG